MRYLLDTNILSEMMKPAPHAEVERWMESHEGECSLSVLVLAELADGVEALPAGKKRSELATKLNFLLEDYADQILVLMKPVLGNRPDTADNSGILGECHR